MFNQIAGNFSAYFTNTLTGANSSEKLNIMQYALSHRLTQGS